MLPVERSHVLVVSILLGERRLADSATQAWRSSCGPPAERRVTASRQPMDFLVAGLQESDPKCGGENGGPPHYHLPAVQMAVIRFSVLVRWGELPATG